MCGRELTLVCCYHACVKRSVTSSASWRQALKVIGVLLFAWLLASIDRGELLDRLRSVDIALFWWSIALLMISYAFKVWRWHVLLGVAGMKTDFRYAWETYYIGTFLGMITPGKLGEFGRAAYLRRGGMGAGNAVAIMVLDRAFDVLVIGMLSLCAAGILFGSAWVRLALWCTIVLVPFLPFILRKLRGYDRKNEWIATLRRSVTDTRLTSVLITLTTLSWVFYCLWSLALAAAIGLEPPALPFMSAVIFAGIVSMLPVAPSGLGTRDASLIWMLSPMGIAAEQTLAITFLMFVTIILTTIPGAWYWLRGVREPKTNSL